MLGLIHFSSVAESVVVPLLSIMGDGALEIPKVPSNYIEIFWFGLTGTPMF